jgi:hypothetical protein
MARYCRHRQALYATQVMDPRKSDGRTYSHSPPREAQHPTMVLALHSLPSCRVVFLCSFSDVLRRPHPTVLSAWGCPFPKTGTKQSVPSLSHPARRSRQACFCICGTQRLLVATEEHVRNLLYGDSITAVCPTSSVIFRLASGAIAQRLCPEAGSAFRITLEMWVHVLYLEI